MKQYQCHKLIIQLIVFLGKNWSIGCLNLASGLPDPDLLPFKEAIFTLKNGKALHLPQHLMDVAFQYSVSDGYVVFFMLSSMFNPEVFFFKII